MWYIYISNGFCKRAAASSLAQARSKNNKWIIWLDLIMAKVFSESFYNSKAWKKCRASYIRKRIMVDGGMCEKCHEQEGYIVHHKILLTPDNINNPGITLNHSNLAYVCKPCHDLEDGHGVRKKDYPIIMFDALGDPIPPINH